MTGMKKAPHFARLGPAYAQLSKAALADIAWNLAGACCESAEDADLVFQRFAEEARITLGYRHDRVPSELEERAS